MISAYIIPVFLLLIFIFAIIKHVKAYEAFIDGLKDGVKSVLKIAPSMITMYICINTLRASGLISDLFKGAKEYADLISQALFRPLSNHASIGFMVNIYNSYKANSKLAYVSSILQGSTDSSIYIISFYLGSFKVTNMKKCYLIGILVNIIAFVICLVIYLII